jgi:site-specific DNA-cytosine methylase
MTWVLEGFAGPGGLGEGLALLGVDDSLGIELNADACATAEAAGHRRLRADIRSIDPADFPDVELWASGPPCQTYSDGGKQSGIAEQAKVAAGIVAVSHGAERPTDFADPRTALVLETLEFAIQLPNVRVVIAEQVPPVRPIWIEMCAELAAFHHYESVQVVTVRCDDLGVPNRRARVFLVAARDYTPDLSALPTRARWSSGRFAPGVFEHGPNLTPTFPTPPSMAEVLDWPAGITVNTRGDRKTAGGNLFRADGPPPSLTHSARTWYRTDLGSVDGRLTAAEAGVLQGFPRDYPWHAGGSRTSQFQRIADSVCPIVGAAVVGAALNVPWWQEAVRQRLADLYGQRMPRPSQLDLLAEVA